MAEKHTLAPAPAAPKSLRSFAPPPTCWPALAPPPPPFLQVFLRAAGDKRAKVDAYAADAYAAGFLIWGLWFGTRPFGNQKADKVR